MNNLKTLLFKIFAVLFARTAFEPFNQFLVDLGYRGLGILNWQSFSLSGELFLSKYLKQHYALDTVFDVGANRGCYAKNYIGTARKIFCFEPVPSSFQLLKATFSGVDSVVLIQKALSHQKGQCLIYDYETIDGSSHASLYQEVITEVHHSKSKETKIELTTMDDVVKEYGISRINLLKIDTEGHELQVLQGARKTLAEKQIDIIHTEFNEMNVISRTFVRDIAQLLSAYNLYRLLPRGFLSIKNYRPPRYEIFAFQNILAIRKELDKKAS